MLLVVTGSVSVAEARQPNIVFILADDVGIEPLGCYGGASFATPRIDELASSGMRFEHCYSMPVCHPTRVCFLTGRYPRRIGNPAWGSFPKQFEPHTFARRLQDLGYSTAVAGKWQLALLAKDLQQPNRMGFDEYCLFGWHEGPRYHEPLIYQNESRRGDTQGMYGPDLYVDFLIDFFRQHRDEPFFAFYSMALCHDVTDDLDDPVPYAPSKDRYLNYGEMVHSMDDCVGRIVDALDELQLRENTWIIFTGDNGTAKRSIIRAEPRQGPNGGWRYVRQPVSCEISGVRRPGGKGDLTDAGTNVPLIVSRPKTIAPNRVIDDLVDFSDFFPTFVQLAGGKTPSDLPLDGVSFAPRLLGTGADARRFAYSERGAAFWLRTQKFKLMSTGEFLDVRTRFNAMPLQEGELTQQQREIKKRLTDEVNNLR